MYKLLIFMMITFSNIPENFSQRLWLHRTRPFNPSSSFIDLRGLMRLNSESGRCSYGERGSLTATCVNMTNQNSFKLVSYRFDHLDETVNCVNCSLTRIESGFFDLPNNKVITLNLRDSKILSIGSRSFLGLLWMENLILSENYIGMISPFAFVGAKKLQYLDLDTNNLSYLKENTFAELVNLSLLDLSNNTLNTIDDGTFNNLDNLKELDLSRNRLSNLSRLAFDGLSTLEVLDLQENRISDLIQVQDVLVNLLDLNLSKNNITLIPPHTFAHLNNLEKLSLSHNNLQSVNVGAFNGLYSLEYLDLSNNEINLITTGSFIRLPKLREVNLAHNKLKTFSMDWFGSLIELRRLNFSHNAIEKMTVIKPKNPKDYITLHSLQMLDISSNPITTIGYRQIFKQAPRLVGLIVENVTLPCFELKEMMDFFKGDHVMLKLNNEASLNCTDAVTKRDNDYENEMLVDLENRPSEMSFAPMYVILLILIALLCVLSYFQYKMCTEKGKEYRNRFNGTTASFENNLAV